MRLSTVYRFLKDIPDNFEILVDFEEVNAITSLCDFDASESQFLAVDVVGVGELARFKEIYVGFGSPEFLDTPVARFRGV